MRRRDNQQGQIFAMFGVFLFAFLAAVAIAVNLGRLYFVARETQTVADASAIGGAVAYIKDPTFASAQSGAQTEASLNYANNKVFNLDDADILVGNWANGMFTIKGTPPNAVRTTPTVQVLNILPLAANILNSSGWSITSQVQRGATAAFQPLGQAKPDLPIMLAECVHCDPGVSGCSQTLMFEPTGGKDAAWWPQSTCNGRGNKCITDYIPTRCNSGGPGDPIDTISTGAQITVGPGQRASICSNFVGCVGQTFIVPVVTAPCGTNFAPGSPATVAGFSVITITNVTCPPAGDSMTIEPHLVDCSTPNTCTGGSNDGKDCATITDCPNGECDVSVCQGSSVGGSCPQCGTGKVALVQ